MCQQENLTATNKYNSQQNNAVTTTPNKAVKDWKDGWIDVCPAPDDLPLTVNTTKITIGGKEAFLPPDKIYNYYDKDGHLLMVVWRIEADTMNKHFPGHDSKHIVPRIVMQNKKDHKLQWQKADFRKNTPLYNLYNLYKYPDKPLLVVSGEKCVDAVRYCFSRKYPTEISPKIILTDCRRDDCKDWDFIPVTWRGSDTDLKKVNFAPLKDRQLLWWPDNDPSSKNVMQTLANTYGGDVLEIDETQHEKGWDVADYVKASGDVMDFINGLTKRQYGDPSIAMPNRLFLHKNNRGTPICTPDNIRILMDYYGYVIRYNITKREMECTVRGEPFEEEDHLNRFYNHIKGFCLVNRIEPGNANGFVSDVAYENAYNPVKDWLHSKKWDGVERVQRVIDSLVLDENFPYELKQTLITKWLLSCYRAAVRANKDGFRAEGVLVLQGPGGIGKTRWFEVLVSNNTTWFGNGKKLDVSNKDSLEDADSYWIMEFGELDRMIRDNVSELKAFLTQSSSTYREPYQPKKTTIYRRTVFCGTINPENFLKDPTGNRRFWVLPVVHIEWLVDMNKTKPGEEWWLDFDFQQMWAEVKECYHEKGVNHTLTREEQQQLEIFNADHETLSTVKDLISSKLDWENPPSIWQPRTLTEILNDIGIKNPTHPQMIEAGMYLNKLIKIHNPEYVKPRKMRGGTHLFLCPKIKTNYTYNGVTYYANNN